MSTVTRAAHAPLPPAPRRAPASHLGDRLCKGLCGLAAMSLLVIAASLLSVLVVKSIPSIAKTGWHFFVEDRWDVPTAAKWDEPTSNQATEGKAAAADDDPFFTAPTEAKVDLTQPPPLGALAFIYGTLFSSALAMIIAIPLGVGTAAYLSEIAPEWVRKVGATLVEMLAAVPSVVYGFWGVMYLGPKLNELSVALGGPNFGGIGLFPAGIILGIMVLPYVCAIAFDVCQAVPSAQRQGALALGATRWQTIWTVVLPYARPGIVAGCFIALGRALGETMAVTMLIGNTPQVSLSLFSRAATIPSVIANELPNAYYDLYSSALIEMGLVLFGVTLLVNIFARMLLWRLGRMGPPSRLARLRHAAWDWLFDRGHAAPVAAGAGASLDGSAIRNGNGSTQATRPPARLRAAPRSADIMNKVMTVVLGSCLALTVAPLVFVLWYIVVNGLSGLSWDLFTKLPVPQGETGGGLANAIVGSLQLVGAAAAVAVPLGILAAVYLAEYKNGWLAPAVRFVSEAMGGVPSIVIGIFAYALIIEGHRSYFGWAGAFALAVMMIPIVMRTTEEALKLVPQPLRHGSLALGAHQWQTLVRVTLPAALPSVLTAVFLSISRVIGETAPLLITAGNNRYWPSSMSDYVPSLPYYIYYYATNADEIQRAQAWAAALVLLVLVMALNYGVRALTGKRVVLAARAD